MEEIIQQNLPPALFKGFTESSHADNFQTGNIRVTTLSVCKALEDPIRADAGEASMTYEVTHSGEGMPDFPTIARRIPIVGLENAKRAFISNVRVTTRFVDRYLLCTSSKYLEHFGKAIIRINDPIAFFRLLTVSVAQQVPPLTHTVMGEVRYRERRYLDADPDPGPPAYVKPSDPFSRDWEVRMLWEVQGFPDSLAGFEISNPELSRFIERVK